MNTQITLQRASESLRTRVSTSAAIELTSRFLLLVTLLALITLSTPIARGAAYGRSIA